LEHVVSKISSPQLFTICAKFYINAGQNRKGLDFSQKAYRELLHNTNLLESKLVFAQLCHVTIGLVDAYKMLGPLEENIGLGGNQPVCKDWNYQARMALKSVISKTKAIYDGTDDYLTLCQQLQSL
jgi:hypothetical protein